MTSTVPSRPSTQRQTAGLGLGAQKEHSMSPTPTHVIMSTATLVFRGEGGWVSESGEIFPPTAAVEETAVTRAARLNAAEAERFGRFAALHAEIVAAWVPTTPEPPPGQRTAALRRMSARCAYVAAQARAQFVREMYGSSAATVCRALWGEDFSAEDVELRAWGCGRAIERATREVWAVDPLVRMFIDGGSA